MNTGSSNSILKQNITITLRFTLYYFFRRLLFGSSNFNFKLQLIYYAHHKSAPPPSVERERFSEMQAQLFLHVVCQFLRFEVFASTSHWHPMKIVANHVLVTSKQHHNMVSRPFFNDESNGWTGGSVFPPSTDVSVVISAASFCHKPTCRYRSTTPLTPSATCLSTPKYWHHIRFRCIVEWCSLLVSIVSAWWLMSN